MNILKTLFLGLLLTTLTACGASDFVSQSTYGEEEGKVQIRVEDSYFTSLLAANTELLETVEDSESLTLTMTIAPTGSITTQSSVSTTLELTRTDVITTDGDSGFYSDTVLLGTGDYVITNFSITNADGTVITDVITDELTDDQIAFYFADYTVSVSDQELTTVFF